MTFIKDGGERVLSMRLPVTDALRSHRKVGDFDLVVVKAGLGTVRWRGVEVLRGVHCLLRDENWATFLPEKFGMTAFDTVDGSHMTFMQTFELGGLAVVKLTVTVQPVGCLDLAVEITATRDFLTNRAGLVVLHPIRNVAGTKVTVVHPDHSETETAFPTLISPSQPVSDIAALSHQIGGTKVRITFTGDVFEMEDQRNWSDASFKTYCRPLALPFPFQVLKGEVIRQTLKLHVAAGAGFTTTDLPVHKTLPAVPPVKPVLMPELLLAVEDDWLPTGLAAEKLMMLQPAGLLVRVHVGDAGVRSAVTIVQAAWRISELIDLEIVLGAGDAREILARLAAEFEAAGVSLRRVFALPVEWMQSYQPGATPPLASVETCIAAAASAFPKAQIGAGMMTNFAELNRARPPSGVGQFITHGNTAIVHAADDVSVWQTLEALPHIFESAQAIALGRAYRLGLVSIGMRSNPYGTGLASNPDRQKIAMTGEDPRQTTTFAAAYAIGAAITSAMANVQAVALAAPVGRFGIMRCNAPGLTVYPLFHAMRALNRISGKSASVLQGLDEGLFGVQGPDGAVLLANCSPIKATFHPAKVMHARILNDGDAATADPDWLDTGNTQTGQSFELAPGSCLFAKMAVMP